MYKITYYIGCNDKDTLKQELSDTQIISVIDYQIAKLILYVYN